MEDTEYEVTGRIYLASEEQLKNLIETNNLDVKDLATLSRDKLVKVVLGWLDEVRQEQDAGKTKIQDVIKFLTATKGTKPTFGQTQSSVQIKKQFKISGEVDRSGISFASVLHQIRTGQSQGYGEMEIVDGVLKGIPTSAAASRNYLDSKKDLTLSSLKDIWRSHYNEKTPTELYSDLGSLVQGNKEGPSDFLIRAMDLRYKILSESEDASELKYSPELVQGLFSRSVQTGLKDLSVRQEFRPYIEAKEPKDEDLIQALNRIVSRENERRTKRGRTEVHSLSTEEAQSGMMQNLAAEMKALRAEVAELRSQRPASGPESGRPRYGGRGCSSCKQKGVARNCRHCWMCGADDHRKRDCPNKPRNEQKSSGSGN